MAGENGVSQCRLSTMRWQVGLWENQKRTRSVVIQSSDTWKKMKRGSTAAVPKVFDEIP